MKISNVKNCNRKKILMVVAGGTGGHIYPSLSLINKMSNYNFIIITDQRGGKYYENFFEKKSLNFEIFTQNGFLLKNNSKKKILLPKDFYDKEDFRNGGIKAVIKIKKNYFALISRKKESCF